MAVTRPSTTRRHALILVAVVAVAALSAVLLTPAIARAGTWTLVSCTLPDGSPAPTDGWTPGVYGAGFNAAGSGDVNTCPTAGYLTALSSSSAQPASFTGPEWTFTAPAGMTIAGGEITAALTAPQGQAWLGTPTGTADANSVLAICTFGGACGPAGTASGVFPIIHPGGTSIYAPAICVSPGQVVCPAGGGAGGVNAEVSIHSAEIELDSSATPTATGFAGTLMAGRASGTAKLQFTAADPGLTGGSGPGIYAVTVTVDGTQVYAGTPNTNGGACAPVGTDPADGALMFDSGQPCKPQETVTVPVDTTKLPDGPHTLAVTVTDAAGNTSTLTPKTFTTSNPLTTPAATRPDTVTAQFVLGFGWKGATTTLVTAGARSLPRGGTVAVSCTGPGCPQLTPATVPVSRIAQLFATLKRQTFRAGDRLYLTVSPPPLKIRYHKVHGKRRPIKPPPGSRVAPENVRLTIRRGARPGVRLVGSVPKP